MPARTRPAPRLEHPRIQAEEIAVEGGPHQAQKAAVLALIRGWRTRAIRAVRAPSGASRIEERELAGGRTPPGELLLALEEIRGRLERKAPLGGELGEKFIGRLASEAEPFFNGKGSQLLASFRFSTRSEPGTHAGPSLRALLVAGSVRRAS